MRLPVAIQDGLEQNSLLLFFLSIRRAIVSFELSTSFSCFMIHGADSIVPIIRTGTITANINKFLRCEYNDRLKSLDRFSLYAHSTIYSSLTRVYLTSRVSLGMTSVCVKQIFLCHLFYRLKYYLSFLYTRQEQRAKFLFETKNKKNPHDNANT